jgi:dUTP pyrophosphatase
MVTINYKILDERVTAPSYAHAGDAGLDLRSTENLTIKPGQRCIVSTGVSFEIPEGFAGLVIPRSGLAAKHGISIVNAPGLIDSGYRGEIKVILLNTSKDEAFEIQQNDRIAQIMFVPFCSVNLNLVDELSESERNLGGFGSSGVK